MTDSSPTAAFDFPVRFSDQSAPRSGEDWHAALSSSEEHRLFQVLWTCRRRSREAQRARTRLVIAHLPMVASIAAEVAAMDELPASMAPTDLLQEGSIALVRAVDRYHPAIRTRFAAFGRAIIRRR